MKIIDGNTACSNIAYLFSEVCSIYPITPSSPMAENIDNLITKKVKNIFNSVPSLIEMQSEAGAAGTLHGAALTGSLVSTFTASQGLLLMIPNMYKIAGEMLPVVIHVASRSLATQSLSIFGDHQDIYATRPTGFCILASTNVYDAQNLAAVAHLSAIEGSLPFVHFFDGFRTSHEINTIKELTKEDILPLVNNDKINEFKNRVLHVGAKKQFGLAENEDIYFQSMEARNKEYEAMPDIVTSYMNSINSIQGTDYKPFNYYGASDAENIIIAMGSVCDTIKQTIDILNENGDKTGLIEVHLYRPFSSKYLLSVLPNSVKNIAVLDRTKEAGSNGEPLYLDVLSVVNNKDINIVGGRYGISSKNVTPSDIAGIYKMLKGELKNQFTIGIVDDVTNLSIEPETINIEAQGEEIKIFGFGSDGMVSASKDLLRIIEEQTHEYVQGYFEYDSKKSGGVTVSHLRFSKEPINMPYYVEKPKITVVTKLNYFSKYDIVDDLLEEGILLINTNQPEDIINNVIPNRVKELIQKKHIKVMIINADDIANKHHITGKISKIMEMALLHLLGYDDLKEALIEGIKKKFKTKGEDIVNNNIEALEDALTSLKEINLKLVIDEKIIKENNIFDLIENRKGNALKVSDVEQIKDGSFPSDLSRLEKRHTSLKTPIWNKDNCIQCGQCSLVCPHAVIRSFLTKNKDEGIPLIGNTEYNYLIKVSTDDCTGCGLCANICPGKMGKKALEMIEYYQSDVKEYFNDYENPDVIDKYTIKGSQLQKPLFEFSGACAGCGETPYIKLLTQVVGPKLMIANATGCSSIYGGSAPATPYLVPWANSLFEDNAEFALGMKLSLAEKQRRIQEIIEDTKDSVSEDIQKLYQSWLDNQGDYKKTMEIVNELKNKDIPTELKDLLIYMPAYSVWAIGGDGWAYDIGYGGLDHILHSNEDINVLVLDTEVYSNTGGQSSKATNLGAVASFANMGKKTNKKDLFKIAMSIPNCYVASISLGANMMQAIKAFKEAEEHKGPSIIIAYCPCVEQGIKTGMGCSIEEEKLAVECGYTMLMRYNPTEDKLYIDSKEPDFDKYMDFLNNEVRFNALMIKDKELATKLLEEQKEHAKKRYEQYKNMVN